MPVWFFLILPLATANHHHHDGHLHDLDGHQDHHLTTTQKVQILIPMILNAAIGAQKVRRPLHTGQMERVGKMTDKVRSIIIALHWGMECFHHQELAQIEDLLNKVEDDGDMVHLVVPPPPFTSMGHRWQRWPRKIVHCRSKYFLCRAPTLMCQVGDRVYCPGEVVIDFQKLKTDFHISRSDHLI